MPAPRPTCATSRLPARALPVGGPKGASRLVGCVLVGFLLAGLGLARVDGAHARETDDTPDGLRRELLLAQTPGAWEATLQVVLARPPVQVAEVLAPLFLDGPDGRPADLLPFLASYLVAHPAQEGAGARIVLADLVLAQASAGESSRYLGRIHDAQVPDRRTGRRSTWDLLLTHAREALAAPWSGPAAPGAGVAPAVREGAVAALAWRPGDDVRTRLAWLAEGARALPPRLEGDADGDRGRVEGALLAALRDLAAYPFEDLGQALTRLEAVPPGVTTYVDLLRWFSGLKDGTLRDHDQALRYGRELIRRLEGPTALAKAVADDTFPYPELRRALLERAVELKPKSGGGWEGFLVAIIARFPEADLVGAALDLLTSLGFGAGQKECCPEDAARVIQQRLQQPRRPADPPDLRVRLTRALGDLGVAASLHAYVRGVLEARDLPPVEEVVELISGLGRAPGSRVETLHRFYAREGLAPEVRSAVRAAVARALRQNGIVGTDRAAASAALESILTGGGAFDRAGSPKVREEALRSLALHPEPWAVELLLKAARAPGAEAEAEARLALQVIAQMAGQPEGAERAAEAYVALLLGRGGAVPADDLLILALKRAKDVAGAPRLSAAARQAVVEAVRQRLEAPEGGEPLRLQAARSAADLGDAAALAPAVRWLAGLLSAGAADGPLEAVRALIEAVVRLRAPREPGGPLPDPDPDALVATAVNGLAGLPRQRDATLAWFDPLVRGAVRNGAPRPLLLLGQAQLHLTRAAQPESPEAQRSQDRGAARTLLAAALPQARSPEEGESLRLRLLETLQALAEGLAPAEAAPLLYEAVVEAARGTTPESWKVGARLARRLASEPALAAALGPAETAEAERLRVGLEERLAKAPN